MARGRSTSRCSGLPHRVTTSRSETRALRVAYERELVARGFHSDAAQLAALDRLETLRNRVLKKAKARTTLAARLERGLLQRALPKRRVANSERCGVYLWGPVGRGKTWLMDLFDASLPLEIRRRSHFHRFMQDFHARLRAAQSQSNPLQRVAADIAAEVSVICFDELSVSDIADAMLLGGLFAALLDQGVELVFTANVPPRDLYRDGLQRARFLPTIGLLEHRMDVVCVNGEVDYRLRHLTQAAIYLPSDAADTPARLAEIFDDLADGEGESDGHIEINERSIPVRRESENVVWFDFDALCDGPRSAADYITIAREYQSVLMANVPRFNTGTENTARRFIALVDEFYDRNVKLILSAAAAPDALYRGERLKIEFQRTTSRLIEMQSVDYLARAHRL